jgi:hypothetical protein
MDGDEALLRKAEKALTEIKVSHGLSDRHASVLAALRIRLKGDAGSSLEDLLDAAGDLGEEDKLQSLLSAEPKQKPSLDDMLAQGQAKKPEWPGS